MRAEMSLSIGGSRQLNDKRTRRRSPLLFLLLHIRIGAPRTIIGEKLKDDPVRYRRDLGAFISGRDLQQLYVKSIETPDVRNEDGLPFQVFYGISNNTRAFWSIASARRVICYEPEDDSEQLFADDIRRYLTAPGRTF